MDFAEFGKAGFVHDAVDELLVGAKDRLAFSQASPAHADRRGLSYQSVFRPPERAPS